LTFGSKKKKYRWGHSLGDFAAMASRATLRDCLFSFVLSFFPGRMRESMEIHIGGSRDAEEKNDGRFGFFISGCGPAHTHAHAMAGWFDGLGWKSHDAR
jgi:hypothetical protein